MTAKSKEIAVPPILVSSEPLTVRIGVTGHRTLHHPERVTQALTKVLTRLDELFTGDHRYKVLSALAEGADRLVARFILDWQIPGCDRENCQPALDVILPMPEEIFFDTFDKTNRAAAISGFQAFQPHAQLFSVRPAPPSGTLAVQKLFYENDEHRRDAYLKNGRAIADHCQILIAVWNQKPARGKGGTAEVVAYARSRGYSVIHIHSETGKVHWPHHADDYLSQLQNLEEYNSEKIDRESVAQKVDQRFTKLARQAKAAGLSEHILIPLVAGILPHWEKATRLAAHNRWWYLWTGTFGYALSASAVGVAATLSIWQPRLSEDYFYVEAAIIATVAVLGSFLKYAGWQRRWIDYRYLAERLRAACFLHVAGLPLQEPAPFPDHKVPWLPDGWISIAQKELWKSSQSSTSAITTTFAAEPPAATRAIAKFLLEGWIISQRDYYEKASEENASKNEWSEYFLYAFLIATLGIAMGHAHYGEELSKSHAALSQIMSILAVTLPACAAAVAGITVHWHFHRNYERFSSMSHFIGQIATELRTAAGISSSAPDAVPDPVRLRSVLQEADRAMAHEHEGWRTVFGVRLPGPG